MADINLKRPDMARSSRSMQADSMNSEDDMGVDPIPRHAARGGSSKGPWILLLTVIVIVVALGFLFREKIMPSGDSDIAQGNYQAVFLTNGQVYFGKLTKVEDRYLQLNSIYYLQVTPVLQTGTADEVSGQPTQQQQQQQQLSLVKLGNELHAPVDEMFINRDQVLFIEDLKEDGKVVQAIKGYEEGQQ